MKILHIHLNGPFTENWSYQENHLSDEHARMGHEVTVITTQYTYNEKGVVVETATEDKIIGNGVRLIRVKRHETFLKKYNGIFRPYKILDLINEIKPDFILNHGLIGSVVAFDIIKFLKKNKNQTRLVVDTHEDFLVAPNANTYKLKILRFIRRKQNAILLKYVDKVFYINPACMKYAREYYKIPINKMDLLPLGSDFHIIDELEKFTPRISMRSSLGFSSIDIIISHGGKLDINKRTIELIEAVKRINLFFPNIKLVIFGPVLDDIKDYFFSAIRNQSFIVYLGAIDTTTFYKVFLASDLSVFPGSDSALWQQAICCGNAFALTKAYYADFLDLGGNIEVIESFSPDDIVNGIMNMITNDKYLIMRKIAKEKSREVLSYENIANKVLCKS